MTQQKEQQTEQPELLMPILTPRLVIRAPQKGESQAMFDAIQESIDHIGPWLAWAKFHNTLADTEKYTLTSMEKWMERKELPMRIFDRDDGSFVGGCGFVAADWQVRAFEIGYWVRSSRHGQGLVSEAANAVTRWAFDTLDANRVCIRADATNARSRAVPERLGFELEGILRRDSRSTKGELRDTAMYSRIAKDGLPELDVVWGQDI